MKNKLIKNSIYNFSYQLLILILPFITIPYVSRVLTPEGIGINAYTTAIVGYFVLFGNLGIATYGNREIAYYQQDKEKRSQVFWELFFLRLLTFAFSSLCFVIFLCSTTQYHLIYWMQFLLVLSSMLDVSWYFMGMENFKITVFRNTLVRIIAVVLVFVFVKEANDLWIYVLITTGSALLGSILLLPYLKKEIISPKWQQMSLKKHVVPTLQLFIPQVSIQLYVILNRNMIGVMDSVTSAGFYDQADKLVKILLTVGTSITGVMMPRIANMKQRGEFEKLHKLVNQSFFILTAIGIPMSFGVLALAREFVPLFFGKGYSPVGIVMCIECSIILLISWSSVLGNQYMIPMNRTKEFTISVTIGAISNILLNLVLITRYGVYGAAAATVVSEFLVTAYQIYVLRNVLPLRGLFQDTWKLFLAGIGMYASVLVVKNALPEGNVFIFVEVFVGMVAYALFVWILKAKIAFR